MGQGAAAVAPSLGVLVFAEQLACSDATCAGPTVAHLLDVLGALHTAQGSTELVVVTRGAQAVGGLSAAGGGGGTQEGTAVLQGMVGAALWGLLRSVFLEAPPHAEAP